MKKLIALFALLVSVTVVKTYAGDGSTCDNAIEVDTAFTGSYGAGEYWFTAKTSALPLTLYYYPNDTSAQVPDIYIDLTCTPGVYDDPIIERMISTAGQYNLSFPMHEQPKKEYDEDGVLRYRITYDRNYRDMLYNQGVTYPVPAFVRMVNYSQGNIYIVSKSINSRCRDYVNTFGMDLSLLIAPDDSINTYLWPIGDWINKNYRITWDGEGQLDFYDGVDCILSRNQRVRDHFILPGDTILMNKRRTSDWIADVYQTELYVKLYAQSEGLLHIKSYVEEPQLLEMIVAGISAVIDNENMTISAVLPKGTNRRTALLMAKRQGTIKYIAYNGEVPTFDGQYSTLTLGKLVYNLGGIVVSSATGNTDATLSSILVDGDSLVGFSAGQAVYDEVEATTTTPVVTVETTDTAATYTIKQATGVPGTATITVTAEAGNKQVYTLNFIAKRSRNTDLSSIMVDGEPLTGFTPSTHNYRMYAQSIPVVEAVPADSASTVVIDQAKGVPGFAQIFVTAESGDVDSYTVNFSIDPQILECANSAIPMELNVPISLTQGSDQVIRIPIGKPSLDADSANWAGQRIAFSWSGSRILGVYVGTTCLYDPAHPDQTVLDSFPILKQKGENRYVYYMTPQQTQALGRKSIDGSLYLRFIVQDNGTLTASNWVPNCINTSQLVDLDTELYLPAGHNSENVYKFYMPDWENRSIRLSWEGASNVTMWAAYECEFRLVDKVTNVRPFIDKYQFQASDSKSFDVAATSELKRKCKMYGSDFMYFRFGVEGFPGYLKVEVTGGAPYTKLGDASAEATLSWLRVENGIQITSSKTQNVQVFNLQGMRVADFVLREGESRVIPQGLYIICGESEVGKVL